MIASQIDEMVNNDPALSMMRLFGNLVNVPTSHFVSMASVEDIGEEVCHMSQVEHCNLVLLPWNDRLVIGSILSSSPQEKLRKVLVSTEVPTAVLVEKCLKSEHKLPEHFAKILVVTFLYLIG